MNFKILTIQTLTPPCLPHTYRLNDRIVNICGIPKVDILGTKTDNQALLSCCRTITSKILGSYKMVQHAYHAHTNVELQLGSAGLVGGQTKLNPSS